MSESGQDANEDFFGDFHANVNTSQNPEPTEQNNHNSGEATPKVEDSAATEAPNNSEPQQPAQNTNNTGTDTTSNDFFNVDFEPSTMSSGQADFSDFKFPNGSLPATSDLLDINFGNLPVEPTPPTPGTPSIEVHFSGPSDQTSEVSNDNKSDTDSSAPSDSWSMSTQYPESRADVESVRDDVKSEQSLDDKSQVAEDGNDAFDFPTPKESVVNEQKDDAPVSNTTDAMDFDFPAPSTQPEQQATETTQTPKSESNGNMLLTPVQATEDKPSDDMISVTSDTVPTTEAETKSDDSSLEHSTNEENEKNNAETPKEENVPENVTNAQPSEDFFGSTPVVPTTETPANNTSTSSDFDFPAPSSEPEQPKQDQPEVPESKPEAPSTGNNDLTFDTVEDKQPENVDEIKPVEAAPVKSSNDFEFEGEFTSAPSVPTTTEDKQAENGEESKPVETTPAKHDNDFEFEGDFTSAPVPVVANTTENTQPSEETKTDNDFEFPSAPTPSAEDKQLESPEESKTTETTPVKPENDFEFEGEFTSAPTPSVPTTAEDKQPENVEDSKSVETTPVKSDNDFEFEGEFTSAPSVQTTAEDKQQEKVEESTPVENTPVKSNNDFEFEGEFTSAPSVPANTSSVEGTQATEEKKSDNDFEFEGEFTSAPTPSVPTTNTNAGQGDDDDFFDSEFQAAPTVPQEQTPAPKTGGTFEADFDEDFEDFAQAPTTPQPPVQPPQPVAPQTQWLFDGSETEVHDRLQALVSSLFPAPVPSKILPDINTTVEEKLEELRSSAPAADATAVALPAPSVFAEHLKELLASVGPTTPVPGLQPARTRPKRSPFDTHLSKKEILSLFKKETSAVLHVSPRPTLPSARGKKRKNSAAPSPNTPAAAKQPPTQQPKNASTPPTTQLKAGLLPPTAQPKASPTLPKTNVQVPAQAADTRPKPNETPEEKSNRIVNELVQSVPDLSFMLLEEFRTVNVVM